MVLQSQKIVISMALGCGGLAQLLAGMWEFVCTNTFGATAFSSYGAFWISWALIFILGTRIVAGYETAAADLTNAVAFYLTAWFIFTFCMFLALYHTLCTMLHISCHYCDILLLNPCCT